MLFELKNIDQKICMYCDISRMATPPLALKIHRKALLRSRIERQMLMAVIVNSTNQIVPVKLNHFKSGYNKRNRMMQ